MKGGGMAGRVGVRPTPPKSDASASVARAGLLAGVLTAEELLARRIGRIRSQPWVGAVVIPDFRRARHAARRIDRHLAGAAGPLCGIPVTVKRSIDVAGLPGAGNPGPARHDAVAVARLRRAGAIPLGKSNCPDREDDIDTYSDLGRTLNPWDPARSPGGSSGGGAAVAAGHTLADLGTDYGGSLRLPAACCGVFGYRPTPGLVPLDGYRAARPGAIDSDVPTVGPLTADADDLIVLAEVLTGRSFRSAPLRPAAIRVAGWLVADGPDEACADVRAVVRRVLRAAERAGMPVEPAAPPLRLRENWSVFLRTAYLAARIAAEGAPLPATRPSMMDTAGPGSDDDPMRAWLWAGRAGAEDLVALLRHRDDLRRRWAAWFARYDLLVTPVMPRTYLPPRDLSRPLLASKLWIGGAPRPALDVSIWCALASVCGLPAVSMPVTGTADGGPPPSVQLIAAPHRDPLLLRVTRMFSRLLPAHRLAAHRPPAASGMAGEDGHG
jgi:amidase